MKKNLIKVLFGIFLIFPQKHNGQGTIENDSINLSPNLITAIEKTFESKYDSKTKEFVGVLNNYETFKMGYSIPVSSNSIYYAVSHLKYYGKNKEFIIVEMKDFFTNNDEDDRIDGKRWYCRQCFPPISFIIFKKISNNEVPDANIIKIDNFNYIVSDFEKCFFKGEIFNEIYECNFEVIDVVDERLLCCIKLKESNEWSRNTEGIIYYNGKILFKNLFDNESQNENDDIIEKTYSFVNYDNKNSILQITKKGTKKTTKGKIEKIYKTNKFKFIDGEFVILN